MQRYGDAHESEGRLIGEEIRRRRKEQGLTIPQLAAKAGMAPSAISQIETGKRNPHSVSVIKLAEGLGCEVGDLYPKVPSQLSLDEHPPGEAFFVPLEEGEEEETVTFRVYYVRLLEGDEPIVEAMREASDEEVAQLRQRLEKAAS
jgi:transcriptional regulator with XRE-family HTH domain